MRAFIDWEDDVEALCKQKLGCTWDDLCGDPEPLERAFSAGQTAEEFVLAWAEKYDLTLL